MYFVYLCRDNIMFNMEWNVLFLFVGILFVIAKSFEYACQLLKLKPKAIDMPALIMLYFVSLCSSARLFFLHIIIMCLIYVQSTHNSYYGMFAIFAMSRYVNTFPFAQFISVL